MKKKNYIFPETVVLEVNLQPLMDASQGGVSDGSTPGNEYNENDVTYSRKGFNVWGEEEE